MSGRIETVFSMSGTEMAHTTYEYGHGPWSEWARTINKKLVEHLRKPGVDAASPPQLVYRTGQGVDGLVAAWVSVPR